jgi:hypothetical protein
MVQITGWQKRQKENGDSFNVLNLQGGIEMIKSSTTGKFYATTRKTNMVCTFDEEMCKSMIGQQLPGTIEKEKCEPYQYSVPNSNETITLTHTYVYNPQPNGVEENVFSGV